MTDEEPRPEESIPAIPARRARSRGAKACIGLTAFTVAAIGVLTTTELLPRHRGETWNWQVGEVRGNQIAIEFSYGDCDDYHGYTLKETSESVTIAVRGRSSDGGCTAGLAVPCLLIQLGAPLGDRALLNGKDSHPVVDRGPLPARADTWPCDLDYARPESPGLPAALSAQVRIG